MSDMAPGGVLAWPFLVARGRYRGYRTLLAPDVLARDADYGVLDEVVVPSDYEGQVKVTDAVTRAGRRLTVVYGTHRVTAADAVMPGTGASASAPRDQHSRPLRLLYGFVCLDGQVHDPNPSDLEKCLNTALDAYRQFLADEDEFSVLEGAAFPLQSDVVRRPLLRGGSTPISGRSGRDRHPWRGAAGNVSAVIDRSPILLTLALIAVVLGAVLLFLPSKGVRPTAELPFTGGAPVVFSPDGRVLAVGGRGGVRLWDVRGRRQIGELKGQVGSVAFGSDGRVLAVGGRGGVRLWDVRARRQIGELKGPVDRVSSVVFSPDGRELASADGNTILVWDTRKGGYQSVPKLKIGHVPHVDLLAYGPDGSVITLTTTKTQVTLRRWKDVLRPSVVTVRTGDAGPVALSPDAKTLATASADKKVRLWAVAFPH